MPPLAGSGTDGRSWSSSHCSRDRADSTSSWPRCPGIAPNILTDRLRRLEREGVLVSRKYSDRPARMAYSLTEDGQELAGVLRLLAAWAAGSGGAEGLRHVACGSLLEARWYCPTCAATVDENEEASALRFA